MAKFTHRFAERSQMPDWIDAIPGLHVDRANLLVSGDISSLAVAGANVNDITQHVYKTVLDANKNIRQYQSAGAAWLIDTMNQYSGAILADDMGLGKTRTALWAMKNLPNCRHALIICPASVRQQWAEECNVLEIPCTVLGPRALKKDKLAWGELKQGRERFYITSPNLCKDAFEVSPLSFISIAMDEPHMYLRGRSNKWLWDIADYSRIIPYRMAVTGTPMYNTPRDLWTTLFLLFNMRFGKAKVFDARYCNGKQGTYGWDNSGASNLPELKQRLSYYMLRRTLPDVELELPPITTSFRWVNPTPEAQAAMLQSHGSAHAVDGALDKCLNAKLDEVTAVALTLPNPCVIWTYHRHHATEIAQRLEQGGKSCIPIHGELSVEQRHLLIKQAAENKWSIAATIDSCGTGVNMQGVASTAIFHTIQRIPKKTHQAMKRLHRSGQVNPVHNIFIAMRDAMDEIVVDTVIKKLDYWNELMGNDDLESNVGSAVKPNADTEALLLRSIYEEMNNES